MAFEKVEFTFPDEQDNDDDDTLEIEPSSALTVGEEVKEVADEVDVNVDSDGDGDDGDDDDIDITVVDDTPEKDKGYTAPATPPEEVTEAELSKYSKKVRNRLKKLSAGVHNERREKERIIRERQELENFARTLVNENQQLKTSVGEKQSAILEQAKRAVASELNIAKAKYREAHESGNTEELIAAQDEWNAAQIRASRLNEVKLKPLQEDSAGVKPNVQVDQPPQTDAKAKAWAEQNTWFGTDDEMTALSLAVHNRLKRSGVDTTSKEYYDQIDARMREVFPDKFDDTDQSTETRTRKTNVVASATRSTAPKQVTLSRSQVSVAKRLGVPLKEYARQVAEERKQ